jgi:hypothetical protein
MMRGQKAGAADVERRRVLRDFPDDEGTEGPGTPGYGSGGWTWRLRDFPDDEGTEGVEMTTATSRSG